MSYKLTNVSKGQIVCDLAKEGSTLRLNVGKSQTIKDDEITPHIMNLVSKGMILSEEVSKEIISKKKAVSKKNSNNDKEE